MNGEWTVDSKVFKKRPFNVNTKRGLVSFTGHVLHAVELHMSPYRKHAGLGTRSRAPGAGHRPNKPQNNRWGGAIDPEGAGTQLGGTCLGALAAQSQGRPTHPAPSLGASPPAAR